MIFRQLFDSTSSTFTYVLGDPRSRDAVIVDPVLEHRQRDAALLRELGLTPRVALETHVHADHITGAWWLRRDFGCEIALAAASEAQGADRLLRHGDRVPFGDRHLTVRATPGHTRGCLTYVLDDAGIALTGDCLLIRGTGRTDFQHGDAHTMFRSIRDQILSLPAECLIYPAHDYRGLSVSTVAEERRFNPRMAESIGEEDFVGQMRNLNLPHPRLLDVAVPANLRVGRPDTEPQPDAGQPEWAPLRFTLAGFWEIEPAELADLSRPVQILDVRSAEEFTGPLGHIRAAVLIPLDQLAARLDELSRDLPIVAVCRSGARSAQATLLLEKAGWPRVANLAGGMLRWTGEHQPVERASGAD
ncbi:MAG: MBL fold metallo-hydrolase [Gammaproteobacteria bacterium]|nr:MBL fold metallo-hydrolase [Gammaproteobacteria bacterium]